MTTTAQTAATETPDLKAVKRAPAGNLGRG